MKIPLILSVIFILISLADGVAFLSLTGNSVLAQAAPEVEWSKTYGGSGEDWGQATQQTSDGGYIIVGRTESTYPSSVWLIKTDSNGRRLWDRTFSGSNSDADFAVQQTSDGGYIIGGSTDSAGVRNIWLMKTDASGNKLWDRTFGGSIDSLGHCVRQTSDGGYVIVGTISNGYPPNVWLIKTDLGGNILWDRTFGGSNYAVGWSVEQTSDDGYIIAGETAIPYSGNGGDVLLIKTDSNGSMLWLRSWDFFSSENIGVSVHETSDGGYIVVGATQNGPAGSDDVLLMKTDASGNKLWDRTFGGSNTDDGACIDETSDGGFIITGNAASYGASLQDVWLIRTDSGGNILWDRTFGGTQFDGGESVQQTSDGGYIIAGYTQSFGNGGADVWLIKVVVNNPPDQPSNTSPANGATDVSLTPTLQSSVFSDPDVGDTHAFSQWQITSVYGNYTSISATNLTSITIPDGNLAYSTIYSWKVRYQDNHGAWSNYSEEISFTTSFPPPP